MRCALLGVWRFFNTICKYRNLWMQINFNFSWPILLTFVFGNRSNSKDIVERVSKSCYFLCLIYLLGWTQLYLLKKYPVSAHSFFLRPKLNFFLFGNCFDKKKLSRNFPFQRHLWKSIKNLKTKIVNYSCQWLKNNWIN